jgi:hypothetical protein
VITVVPKKFTTRDLELALDNLASVLKSCSTDISSFCVHALNNFGCFVPLNIPSRIVELHGGFQGIRSFDTSLLLTCDAFSCLAILPRLESLTISIDAFELTKFNSTVPHSLEFPSLVIFSITIDDLHICSELLERQGFGQLWSLTVVKKKNLYVWNLDPFFQTVQNHCSQLQVVVLKKPAADDDNDYYEDISLKHTSPFTTQTLAPLLLLPDISILFINIEATVDLDDIAIRKIANAWPKLRALHLFEQTTVSIPRITLQGLLPLAACSGLEELTLRVDARHPPNFAQIGNIVPARKVHLLDVRTSPVEDYSEDLASFISLTFPSLSTFYFAWSCDDDGEFLPAELRYGDVWTDITAILQPFLVSHPSPGHLEDLSVWHCAHSCTWLKNNQK